MKCRLNCISHNVHILIKRMCYSRVRQIPVASHLNSFTELIACLPAFSLVGFKDIFQQSLFGKGRKSPVMCLTLSMLIMSYEPLNKRSCTVHAAALLNSTYGHSDTGCVLRGRSLLREAKECERLDCANLVPLVSSQNTRRRQPLLGPCEAVPHGLSPAHSTRQTGGPLPTEPAPL